MSKREKVELDAEFLVESTRRLSGEKLDLGKVSPEKPTPLDKFADGKKS